MTDPVTPARPPDDPTGRPLHIAIVTAGGAGMFCGSCMHDNTLARALIAHGAEVSLIPTYTPIRVDEQDASSFPLLMGGINVYLDAKMPLWGRLPRGLTRWLDDPRLLRLVSKFSINSDAKKLGQLTVAMLEGEHGPERGIIEEFVNCLATTIRPDVICFSNAMLVGAVRRLRQEFSGRVLCLLQGDDIFLDALTEPHRTRVMELIRSQARQFDGFLVHSAYYRDYMADYLRLPLEKFHIVPLGIDLNGHDGQVRQSAHTPFTVGYFARICPEKGLHQLLAAFKILHARRPDTRLRAGGYLGARDKAYFRKLKREAAALGDAYEYVGSPAGHAEKVEFLKSLDVLSVPTEYHEPKGLYVLEALANGVPVVQPRHGAFPELIAATGGGLLVNPQDPADLARALERMIDDPAMRSGLARAGQQNVRARFDPQTMAVATLSVVRGPSNFDRATT